MILNRPYFAGFGLAFAIAVFSTLCVVETAEAQETLTLALKTESIKTIGTVERAFELAKQFSDEAVTPAFSYQSVDGVRFINRSDYDLLWDPFPTDAAQPTTKIQGLEPRSTEVRVAKDPFSYVIHSAEGSVVDALEVKYLESSSGESKEATLEKAGEQNVEGPLKMIVPGAYQVQLQSDWHPQEYRVKFSKVNARTATPDNEWSDWAVWPGSKTKYFLVKLGGFQGDPNSILEVLKAKDFLTIKTYEIRKRVSYVAADLDLGPDDIDPGFEFTDEGFKLVIPLPAEARITRVWTLLPIDENEKKDAIEMLEGWDDSDGFEMRSSMNDSDLNKYSIVLPPSDPSQITNLETPSPQWLVIEPVNRDGSSTGLLSYARQFKISSQEDWKERLSKSREMMLMFERDPGRGDRFKFFIDDPDSGFWQVEKMQISAN